MAAGRAGADRDAKGADQESGMMYRTWRRTAVMGAVLALGTMALGLSAGAASAAIEVRYETGGAQLFAFEAPDGWTVRTGIELEKGAAEGERPMPRVISLLPGAARPVMWVGLWSPLDVLSVDEAVDYLDGLNLNLLENPVITAVEDRRINGRAARIVRGDGAREGAPFNFVAVLVQMTPRRVAVAAFIGEPDAQTLHQAALARIVESLRPLGAKR